MITGQVFANGVAALFGPMFVKRANVATQPSPKRISTIVPKNSPIASPQTPARALGVPTARLAIDAHSISATRNSDDDACSGFTEII
jgi:hypothetical protein